MNGTYWTTGDPSEGITTGLASVLLLLGTTVFNGEIPDSLYVDHIDNDPSNNKIDNLQLLTLPENLRKRARVFSPRGCVYFRGERRNPWQAKINYKGRAIHIGSFITEQEAHEALEAWKITNIQGS